MSDLHYKVCAAFSMNGGVTWVWRTWTESKSAGNKHAAIIDKARELGADAWDYGNAGLGVHASAAAAARRCRESRALVFEQWECWARGICYDHTEHVVVAQVI